MAELEEKFALERENLLIEVSPENRINSLNDWTYRFNQGLNIIEVFIYYFVH